MVALDVLLFRCVGDAIGAWKQPIEMIEAAVLRVKDHYRVDCREISSTDISSRGHQH
jgi:hypothetical protein